MTVVVIGNGGAFEPNDLAPVAWWDPMDGSTISLSGSDVTAWASKAAGALTVTQGDAGKRPSVLTVSGRQMISFDGVDEYLSLADAGAGPLKFGSGNFSIYVVYRSDDTNRGTLVSKGGFAPDAYNFRVNDADSSDGKLFCFIRSDVGVQAQVSSDDETFNDNVIRVVAMVRDGNNLRLYNDGAEVSESPADASAVGDINDSNIFSIGAIFSAAQFLNGELGDIVMFNRALDVGERTQLTSYLKERWGIS